LKEFVQIRYRIRKLNGKKYNPERLLIFTKKETLESKVFNESVGK